MNGQMTPMQMIVAAQQSGGMPMGPATNVDRSMLPAQGLMQLPIPQMQGGAGPVSNQDREMMIRDFMRSQGMDPDDPKNAAELAKLKKDFGFMDAIKSAPARGMQNIKDAGQSIQGIFDMMKKLGS
jgi:hypothetical protein